MRQQQQWSAKNIFCKQKSIDDKTSGDSSGSSGRKKFLLRKQLSVDHVTSNLKHTSSSASSSYSSGIISFGNLLWQNSSSVNSVNNTAGINQSALISESNLKITSAIKKRAQFAASRDLSSSISK